MSKYDEASRLQDLDEAKQFAKLSFNTFMSHDKLGPASVLEDAYVIYTAWKRLPPRVMASFRNRLSRYYDNLDVGLLCELGRRQAVANATLASFDASARLHILSQPAPAFDRFLAEAKNEDRMGASALRRSIVESNLFPSDVPTGLTPINDQQ